MSTRFSAILFLALACTPCVADDSGYVVGLGLAIDNGDGYGASALFDYSFNDQASAYISVATTRADARPNDVTTRDWSVGGRYNFGVIGVELFGGQSGDPDDFDSDDLSLGIFHRGEHWQFGARYLQREIDLIFRLALLPEAPRVAVPLRADGYRINARYRHDSGASVGASTQRFDYDRDLTPLGGRFIVQRLSPTTLSLASSLLDRSSTLDVEFPLEGSRAISLLVARDTLAGSLGDVDSVSLGYLMPAGRRGDLDISLGFSKGDGVFDDGNTAFISVLYLYYGGFD